MKKYGIYVWGMICLLSLIGCGSVQQDQENDAQIPDTVQTDVKQEEKETTNAGKVNVENNDSEAGGQEGLKNTDVSAANAKTAVYSQDDLYMSVDIPTGWDCRIKTKEDMEKEDGLTLCAIDFWPESYPDTVFELGYAAAFGMCGTGVTIEEFTLKNGLSGYRYTEEIEDTLWLTITLSNPDNDIMGGTYLIDASPELSVWESINPEFDKILESVWVGSLPNGQIAAGEPVSRQGTDTNAAQYIGL